MEDWLYRRKSVTVAFMDFKKGFDSVAHNKLLFSFRSVWYSGRITIMVETVFQ